MWETIILVLWLTRGLQRFSKMLFDDICPLIYTNSCQACSCRSNSSLIHHLRKLVTCTRVSCTYSTSRRLMAVSRRRHQFCKHGVGSSEELPRRSILDWYTLFHHQHLVALVQDSVAQSVHDTKNSCTRTAPAHRLLDEHVSTSINRCSRLVQQQDPGVA